MLASVLFFSDFFMGWGDNTYDFFMSFLAYTYACAGISYLSNLILVIMIDMGKHRWLFSD